MYIFILNGKIIGTQASKPDPFENQNITVMEWYGPEPRLERPDPITGDLIPGDPIPVQTWESIRTIRTRLLSETDWTQVPDSPLTPEAKSLWANYRQRLRDLTDVYSDPALVIFPPKPEG